MKIGGFMNVYDFILNRRSVRRYKKKNIPEGDIRIILEAASHAPMAYEYKSWKLILVKDDSLKEKIVNESANQLWIKYANILVLGVILGRDDKKWKIVDTAIALENIVLASESLGYGSCWIGAFNEKKIKVMLGIPNENSILAYIAIGFKDEKPKEREYKKLDEIVYLDGYKKGYS